MVNYVVLASGRIRITLLRPLSKPLGSIGQ